MENTVKKNTHNLNNWNTKVIRCDNPECRDIIRNVEFCILAKEDKVKKYYCDKWCKEHVDFRQKRVIRKNYKFHKCKYCNRQARPCYQQSGTRKGNRNGFKATCDVCHAQKLRRGYYGKKSTFLNGKKEIKSSRSCIKCDIVKDIYAFKWNKKNNNFTNVCKECINKRRIELYQLRKQSNGK